MRIKFLKTLTGSYGTVRRDTVREIADPIAMQLIRKGRAVPAPEAANAPANPPKPTTQASKAPRDGGRTGAAKPLSSSPEDQARPNSRSRKAGDGSAPSPSTTDGN